MFNRREFLTQASCLAIAPVIPEILLRAGQAAESNANDRILVVIEMVGGNDGINCVVPFSDEGYAKSRNRLRLPKDTLIRVNDRIALHPSMKDAARLLENGQLAIVQGVGYPDSSESHEVAQAVWHSSRIDPEDATAGWIGRVLDHILPNPARPTAMLVGDDQPAPALRGRKAVTGAINTLEELLISRGAVSALEMSLPRGVEINDDLISFVRQNAATAATTAKRLNWAAQRQSHDTSFPPTELARRLKLTSRLIQADMGTKVFYVMQPGYDTHSIQNATHPDLLEELGGALSAFINDLKSAGLDQQVIVFCFSEFGRRVEENASEGTDHGTAGPVFLAGTNIQGGLFGEPPSLTDLNDGNLKVSVDFRRVYASLLDNWLEVDSSVILGTRFETLPLFRKA